MAEKQQRQTITPLDYETQFPQPDMKTGPNRDVVEALTATNQNLVDIHRKLGDLLDVLIEIRDK